MENYWRANSDLFNGYRKRREKEGLQGHATACPCNGTDLEQQLQAEFKLPFVDAFSRQVLHTAHRHKAAGVGDDVSDGIKGIGIAQ